MENEQIEILDQNMDKTLQKYNETFRKPRGMFMYEHPFGESFREKSFGNSIYDSLLTAFSSIFSFKNLPEGLRSEEINLFLVASGRLKLIKVGSRFLPVHVTPKSYNHYGDWVKTNILEPYLPALNGLDTEDFENVEIKNDVFGESLIRKIYPFISTIDDTLFNLGINQSIIAGKYIKVTPQTSGKSDNHEEENSLSQWLINGKPVKTLKIKLQDDGSLPLKKLEVDDVTQSFIETIQYNYSQMLNVLGIPNNNVEGKKERLITSEINIQNVIQSSIVSNMLEMRKRAIKEFNEKFNTNITVELNNEVLSEIQSYDEEVVGEGEDDE